MPYASVQFHPEAMGGPLDTAYLFDDFVKQCTAFKAMRSEASNSERGHDAAILMEASL